MTEREWTLTRDLLQTRLQLLQSQSVNLQAAFDKTQAELKALGEKYEEPKQGVELKDVSAA